MFNFQNNNIKSIDFSKFKTSGVTNMAHMFSFSSFGSLNLNSFDTSNVNSMEYMFEGCSSLVSLNLNSFDTSNVTNMDSMFKECSSLESLILNSFDTSKVTNMNNMFARCSSLISVNLNNFDTSNVTNMESMFQDCSSLVSLNLNNFHFNNKNLYSMFSTINENLVVCINETRETNLGLPYGLKINCDPICYDNIYYFCLSDICPKNYSKLIREKKLCIIDCNLDDIYKYDYNDTCYEYPLNYTNVTNQYYTDFTNIEILISDKLTNIDITQDINSYHFETDNSDINTILIDSEEVLNSEPMNSLYNSQGELYILNQTTPINLTEEINKDFTEYTNNIILISDKLTNIDITQDTHSYHFETDNSDINTILIDSEQLINSDKENSLNNILEELSILNTETILNEKKIDEILENIDNMILDGNSDEIIAKIKNGEELIFIDNYNIGISLSSSENEKIINLCECENKLKEIYNISKNESLFIYKMIVRKDDMKTPRIEYKIYYPLYKNKMKLLNLTICKNITIEIYIPKIFNNQKEIDQANSSSKSYNDICDKDTTDKGTYIPLNDRKDIYVNNELYPCEENCKFGDYEKNIEKVKCICNTKLDFRLYSEIKKNKTLLLVGFKDIKNIININIMKCYKNLFNNNWLSNNIGFYLILSIILFHLISVIIFYKKDFDIIKNIISNHVFRIAKINIFNNKKPTIRRKKVKSNNKNRLTSKIKNKKIGKNKSKKKNKIKSPPIKKNKKCIKNKRKKNFHINVIQTNNLIENININDNSRNILNNNKKPKTNITLKYTIYELNNSTYKEAIIKDKRTYVQYYLSLIQTKHLLFFSFCSSNDYNSKIIKILLFFILFVVYLIINALFFNDSTMHKLYDDKGKYNILYQIPQIIYSSLISSVISKILKLLALSEQNILELKNIKNKNLLVEESKNIYNYLYTKFILFFLISFILLIIFWYYLSIFCAIYGNTQIHLIKDTSISFGLSMIYPFALYLLPGIFRIPSLRSKNSTLMYNFSKLLQLI